MTNFEPSWQSARRPLGRLREATADLLAMLLEWWDAWIRKTSLAELDLDEFAAAASKLIHFAAVKLIHPEVGCSWS